MNTGIAITMIINTLIAVYIYMSCKQMNNQFARLMIFFWIMIPSIAVILNLLLLDK